MTDLHVPPRNAMLSAQLAGQLAALAALVAEPAENPGDPITDLLRVVTTIVPGARWATLTERNSRGSTRTVATTDPAGRDADLIQHRAGEGPTLDAMRLRTSVTVHDLRAETRWPRFTELALAETPVRAMVAHPVRGTGAGEQTLNLYADAGDVFLDTESTVAAFTMASTETALAGLAQRARAANLHRALMSNRRIGVAIGILMARERWTEDQAFAAMCEASQSLNRKLRDLAEDVALTGALPELPELPELPPPVPAGAVSTAGAVAS